MARALLRGAEASGVGFRFGAKVEEVVVDGDGRARGVRLADGGIWSSKCVCCVVCGVVVDGLHGLVGLSLMYTHMIR